MNENFFVSKKDFEEFYKEKCPNSLHYTTLGSYFPSSEEIAYNLQEMNGLGKKLLGAFSKKKRDNKLINYLVKIINEEVTHAVLNKADPSLTSQMHHIIMWLLNNYGLNIYPYKSPQSYGQYTMFSHKGIKKFKGKS